MAGQYKPSAPKNPSYWKLSLVVSIFDGTIFVKGPDGKLSSNTSKTFRIVNAFNKPRTFSPHAVKGSLLVNVSSCMIC